MASAPAFTAPFPNSPVAAPASPSSSRLPSFLSPLGSFYNRINDAREKLNLPEPGKAEELGREVKITQLTNYTFDGARADLSKTLSQVPAFQVQHTFAAGAQGGPMGGISPGTYNFAAIYATPKTFMQGTVDNEGTLMGRFNYGFNSANTSKVQVQLPGSAAGQPMVALEHDLLGRDYSFNFKTYNPSLTDLSGTYLGSYLQSVTPHLALGVEGVYQRSGTGVEDTTLGYMAKWHHVKKDELGQPAKDSWIATAQILPIGLWTASYWKKLGERVDAGVDLQMMPAVDPKQRKAIATAAVKYDFRMASFRGQVDSEGKVSALLEQRISPSFAFLVAGEMDHVKSTSKFGVGITVESADETALSQMEAGVQPGGPPPL